MDLSTTYLGLKLPHPVMPGASPLVDDLGEVRRLEDAGAAAIVMHSLFEEQITIEQLGMIHQMELLDHSHAEALSYFPRSWDFRLGPDQYLEQIRAIKAAVGVPVFASLNGVTPQGWLEYARLIQDAGADGLELNFYFVAADPRQTGTAVEERLLETVRLVKQSIRIPVAVKIGPFYSSVSHLASQVDALGVDGLVLFNRFYQPDIDAESLEVVPRLQLSDSSELLLRLRWLAILAGHVRCSLAASGGIHVVIDAVKAIMAGAHAVQVVAALLQRGPAHLTTLVEGMKEWFERHDYKSLEEARGTMSLQRCPDPAAFERGNYMRILQRWRLG